MDFDEKFDAHSGEPLSDASFIDWARRVMDRPVRVIRRLAGGYRSTNLLVEIDGARYVARISKGRTDAAKREASLLERLHGAIPVPQLAQAWFAQGADDLDVLLVSYAGGALLSRIED